MKPSERDPGATMLLMELANEAGFPKGTVNVIHGAHDGNSEIICFVLLMKSLFHFCSC
jgi:acyl-CoA reductase-like NAD-dependent aldehyde dehydrogenase